MNCHLKRTGKGYEKNGPELYFQVVRKDMKNKSLKAVSCAAGGKISILIFVEYGSRYPVPLLHPLAFNT